MKISYLIWLDLQKLLSAFIRKQYNWIKREYENIVMCNKVDFFQLVNGFFLCTYIHNTLLPPLLFHSGSHFCNSKELCVLLTSLTEPSETHREDRERKLEIQWGLLLPTDQSPHSVPNSDCAFTEKLTELLSWIGRSTDILSYLQSLSHAWFFVTPWTAACQASLSITNFRSLLKLMSIESVMPSSHLILCHPLLLLPSLFPSIRVFWVSSSHQVAKDPDILDPLINTPQIVASLISRIVKWLTLTIFVNIPVAFTEKWVFRGP